MSRLMISMIMLCLFAFMNTLSAQETYTIDLENNLPKLISFKDVPGHVKVVGADVDFIEISVEGFKVDKETVGLRPLYASGKNTGLGVAVEQQGDQVTITGLSAKGNQQYVIKVPGTVPLKMIWNREHFFGRVEVEGHRADLEMRRINGEMTIIDVTGPMSIYAMDAKLEVAFADSDLKGPVSISTFHSDIRLKLKPDAKLNLKMRSGKGELFSAFEIEDKAFENDDTDDCVDCVPRVLTGKLNGGGTQFILNSYAGNIYLLKDN